MQTKCLIYFFLSFTEICENESCALFDRRKLDHTIDKEVQGD